MRVGTGDIQYETVDGWGMAGRDRIHYGNAPSVAVDSEDNVLVFTRSSHGVVVYDRDGRFLDMWGGGMFTTAHGIRVFADDEIWCVDAGSHVATKHDRFGNTLMTLGDHGRASDTGARPDRIHLSDITRSAGPFNKPTQIARGQNGDLYVSDGYGNARVHQFSAEGELIRSWGRPGGSNPGEFRIPHSVWMHVDGRLFVADRENDRIQIFTEDGEYLDQWTGIPRPADIWIDGNDLVYVTQIAVTAGKAYMGRTMTMTAPNSLTIRDLDGRVLSSWGREDRLALDGFVSPHSICVDSSGDIYVGQNVERNLQADYHEDIPKVRKFRRI